MDIQKKTIRASPFVGVFCVATDKQILIPETIQKKEEKGLGELLGVETVKASLAQSPLLGVLAVGNKKGFVVSNIVEDFELEEFEKKGIKVKRLSTITAIGNLVELNDKKGIVSKAVPEKAKKEIETFLKVKLKRMEIGESEISGSSLMLTNKGFVSNPNISDSTFENLSDWVGFEGKTSTANMGDIFIGNSICANSNAAIVGSNTTGQELIRIDEGLNAR